MTRKERVYTALRHEEADLVPYNIPIEGPVNERLNQDHYHGNWPPVQDHFDGLGWNWWGEWIDESHTLDCFGVVWKWGSIFHIEEPLLAEPDLSLLTIPEFVKEEELPAIDEYCEKRPESFNIFSIGLSFFERAWALRGMENILMDMAAEPAFVHGLMEGLMEAHLAAIKLVARTKVDAIWLGDDVGAQKGLIMGKPHWQTYLRPRLAKMYAAVRESGKILGIHTCGDNTEVIGDFLDMGVQIIDPFQPEAMDVYSLKREYGKDVTFKGGIGTQVLLPHGTPESILGEINRLLVECGKGGGFILEPTKPIMADVPTANAVACIEAMVNQDAWKERSN